MTSPAALHSVETVEHYTPQEIIESARKVLGRIDLDPFSSEAANRRVRATYYGCLPAFDAFNQPWEAVEGARLQTFINPPGGKYKRVGDLWIPVPKGPGVSGAALAWHTLMRERAAGMVEAAIFVCFSLNVFQAAQAKKLISHFGLGLGAPHVFPFCVPRSRLKYEAADGKVGKSPPHPSAIVYVPPTQPLPAGYGVSAFVREFEQYGDIRA